MSYNLIFNIVASVLLRKNIEKDLTCKYDNIWNKDVVAIIHMPK
ncbi:MAG: hypothetical protein AB2417_14180 [Clostridiaceae bacterium]